MAQTRRLEASAHNTANLNTDDFRALRVSLSESANPGFGVETSVSVSETPGPVLLDESGLLREERGSNVDLVDEAVTRLTASRAYEANLVSVQAQSDMSRMLLEI